MNYDYDNAVKHDKKIREICNNIFEEKMTLGILLDFLHKNKIVKIVETTGSKEEGK